MSQVSRKQIHNLRSSLAIITTACEAILMEEPSEAVVKWVRMIEKNIGKSMDTMDEVSKEVGDA